MSAASAAVGVDIHPYICNGGGHHFIQKTPYDSSINGMAQGVITTCYFINTSKLYAKYTEADDFLNNPGAKPAYL